MPVGPEIRRRPRALPPRPRSDGDGSIIIVVATDAPLLPHQLRARWRGGGARRRRTRRRGEDRGDIFLAFSTGDASAVEPGVTPSRLRREPAFYAAVEATEEAIVNALVAAETMTGVDGNRLTPSRPLRRRDGSLRTVIDRGTRGRLTRTRSDAGVSGPGWAISVVESESRPRLEPSRDVARRVFLTDDDAERAHELRRRPCDCGLQCASSETIELAHWSLSSGDESHADVPRVRPPDGEAQHPRLLGGDDVPMDIRFAIARRGRERGVHGKNVA